AALGEPRGDELPLPGPRDRDPAEPHGVAGAQRQRPEDHGRLLGHTGSAGHPDRHVGTLRRHAGRAEREGYDPIRPPRVRGIRGAGPEVHRADRRRHGHPVHNRPRSPHYTDLPMNPRGYTIVELLVAVMIFSVGLLAMAGTASGLMSTPTRTQSRTIPASVGATRLQRVPRTPCSTRVAGSASAVSRGISEAWTLDHLARADDVTVNVT